MLSRTIECRLLFFWCGKQDTFRSLTCLFLMPPHKGLRSMERGFSRCSLLVHTLAASRVKQEELLAGGGRRRHQAKEAALARLTGQVRRSLSLVAARATARCLLDRLEVLGSGDQAAARRRSWRDQELRRMTREQKAHALGLQHGRAVLQRGEFYLQ